MIFAGGSWWTLPGWSDRELAVAGFWFGVVGTLVGVGSVWLAWWLAKRDIGQRISEAADRASQAAREEVGRLARSVFATGVADAVRWLELGREACKGRQWGRAADLLLLTGESLSRLIGQLGVETGHGRQLREVIGNIREAVARLRMQPKVGTGTSPPELSSTVDLVIQSLHRIDGEIKGIRPGDSNAPQI